MSQPGEPGYPGPDQPPPEPQEEPVAKQAPADQDPAPAQDPRDRAAQLEAELAGIRAGLAGAASWAVAISDGVHSSFSVAGVTVGTSPAPVPDSQLSRLLEAAAEAGVTLALTEV